MNWKKILLFAVGGGFAGSLGHYVSEIAAGHAVAFTTGNILIPAAVTAVSTILGLFTKRPQDTQPGQ